MAVTATKNSKGLDFASQSQKATGTDNHARQANAPASIGSTEPASRAVPDRFLTNAKVKPNELIIFTTQLSVMLDSGVVLSDALDAFAEQAPEGVLKSIIINLSDTVKSGETFSKALSAYPKVFNSMFISMVKASEASGKMAEMLNVLSGYLSFEAETRKRIKGALTYPFIMALMAVAATGTLMFFVLPRFTRIYEARGAALPKITQILVGLSQALADPQIMAVVITSLIVVAIGFYSWAGTATGRRVLDYIKIYTPVLGTMFIDMVVTRSMRIMSTMLNTGVSLLDTLEVIRSSCDNYYFQQLWIEADEKIRDGYQLSEAMLLSQGAEVGGKRSHTSATAGTRLIDAGIIQMLRAGEKSGKLGQVSDKISVFYEKKLEISIKNVMTLIEPLMITFLGAVIGTIAVALLLPVFRISSVIAH